MRYAVCELCIPMTGHYGSPRATQGHAGVGGAASPSASAPSSGALSMKEAAAYIGVGLTLFKDNYKDWLIPFVALGERRIVFRRAALDRWLEEREAIGGAA